MDSAPVAPAVASPEPRSEARGDCAVLFEPPAGAKPLCAESVLAEDSEIVWSSYGVTTDPSTTFEPYRRSASRCGAGVVTKPPILSVRKDEQRLSVHPAREAGYPSCETKPGAEHAAVVVVSRKMDRKR